MRISLRRSKSDSRMFRISACYDVRHDGDVLAKLQEDVNTGLWFWYGMKGVSGNTAHNLRQFNVVKAEVIKACKAHLNSPALPTPQEKPR